MVMVNCQEAIKPKSSLWFRVCAVWGTGCQSVKTKSSSPEERNRLGQSRDRLLFPASENLFISSQQQECQ